MRDKKIQELQSKLDQAEQVQQSKNQLDQTMVQKDKQVKGLETDLDTAKTENEQKDAQILKQN